MSGPGPHTYRAVLFDLDGTLLDSADLIVTSFVDACRTGLGRTVDREETLRTWSWPVRERFEALAPGRGDELTQLYLRRYFELHDHRARLFPGVPAVLDGLRARGYLLGIVTSKRRATTDAAVRTFGLDRWCQAIVVDEDVRRPKPDPEPVALAARRLGVAPAVALMVGDSVVDVAAGRRAGAGTAAALWGTMHLDDVLGECPDHRLERPEALLTVCL
ncbi:MAG TPA: HAD-IA family hydrolase [bacterium]|nr:HAD-IA family hydrolase [bacterium]